MMKLFKFFLPVFLLLTISATANQTVGSVEMVEDNDAPQIKIIYLNEDGLSYSAAVTKQLDKIDPALGKGVKNTKFYSLTSLASVKHKVEGGTLKFIVPSESDLQVDFLPDIEFKYVANPRDSQSSCLKTLGWSSDVYNPKWAPERVLTTWSPYGLCSYHPLVFEGETMDGEKFVVHYLLVMSGAPIPFNYSTNPNSFSEISLEYMPNYGILTEDSPLSIKVNGDWRSISGLTIKSVSKDAPVDAISKFAYSAKDKTYTIDYDNMTDNQMTFDFYGQIVYNYNFKKTRNTRDIAGYEVFVFKGVCRVNGTVIKAPIDEYAMLSCSVKDRKGKNFVITQQQLIGEDGSFSFINVPADAKCSVRTWDMNGAVKIAKNVYTCSNDIKGER